MMRALFAAGSCAMALVIVACSDDPQPATPGTTSTPAAEATAPCSTDDECSPGPCRTSTCSGGQCEKNTGRGGAATADQVTGDCNQVVCNGDGTTRTVADDTDVPAPTECMTFTCSGGTKANTPKAAGTACTGGLCDGGGTCVQGLGTACAKAADCPSNSCVDGVCCNEACTGECKSCSVDGMKGICSNVPYYEEDPSFVPPDGGEPYTCDYAIAGSKCDGKGKCLRISDVTCTMDAQCMSGECSNLKCLGAKGEMCNAHGDCVSGKCVMGSCD